LVHSISAVIFRQNADFFTENKQTVQLIFFVFGHFDRKTKNEMTNSQGRKWLPNSEWVGWGK
jgi:hypothetical protein